MIASASTYKIGDFMYFLPLAPTATACPLSHARVAPGGASVFAQHCATFLQNQICGRLEAAQYPSPQTITGKSYVH